MRPLAMARITLVTPAHVASNPRLVKEADALAEAGYQVHVICCRYFPKLDDDDQTVLARAKWSHTRIDWSGSPFRGARFLSKVLRRLIHGGLPATPTMDRWALHPAIPQLVKAVQESRPDFIVGHCLVGLLAAALSARRLRVPWRFDAEDFHTAETPAIEANPHEFRHVQRIERAHLPLAAQITAASPAIGEAYQDTYQLAQSPLVILNVFPRSQFPASKPASPSNRPVAKRLYWFSQTIGPGRGLEQLLPILAEMKTACSLHLRGFPAAGYQERLTDAAQKTGFTGEIEWLDFAPPEEMLETAAGYDLGLSLEQRTPRNRDYCLTNKIFTYLGAGIPVAMSKTQAQARLADDLGAAAIMLDLHHPTGAAAALDDFFNSDDRQSQAAISARNLSDQKYNWDHEKLKLLNRTAEIISP